MSDRLDAFMWAIESIQWREEWDFCWFMITTGQYLEKFMEFLNA